MQPPVTVFVARRIHTMDPAHAVATAVAVGDGRVVAVGSQAEVLAALGDTPHTIDDTLRAHVLLPGLIDQHLHPLLGATTLATEVVAPEAWVLPGRTFPAAATADEYDARLQAAHEALTDPDEWLLSWGYHRQWHGDLTRQRLDAIGGGRPIGVWQRSCHEFHLNSAAIEQLGLTEEWRADKGAWGEMIDLDRGHFWELGAMNALLPKLAPQLMSRERLTRGLHQLVAYLWATGVTAFNEPGIFWGVEPWDLYLEILGAEDVPILSTFMVDGRTQSARGIVGEAALADAREQVARAPEGKVRMLDGHVKLFADGAIISQLMQMRDPYLDADGRPDPHHHGEWLMTPDEYRAMFETYWAAGWQIHTHVNGDLGLDLVLDTLEGCMAAAPRADHRSVVVHFANSQEDQVDRIARLGAIVSANPYYTVGFADKYAAFGLGPERADAMVRSRSVLDRGVPLSFHSDLPMGPAAPLQLASFAVNRRTVGGRVAGPEQRIAVHDALRAVTIGAAHSWRMETELGSIEPGKWATFTVLAEDPYEVDPTRLGDVPVVGAVFEGRWAPVPSAAGAVTAFGARLVGLPGHGGGAGDGHDHGDGSACSCTAARALARAYHRWCATAA